MTLRSSISNPISPVGADVNLTCIVDIDPAVNDAVYVTTSLTGPGGSDFYVTCCHIQPDKIYEYCHGQFIW